MALRGTTFQNQLVKEKDDGGVYNAIFSDGVVWGCGLSFSGRTVTIAPGMVCIGGRMIAVDGATTFDPGAAVISTGYARLSVRIDVSQTATETECKQVGTFWDVSATTTFLPYTQEDVNYNGTIYEQEICVVQLSGGNITAITRHIGNAIIDAERLGNQLPAYYAKKSEADAAQTTANAAVCASATPRGYSMTDANVMSDGWALCMQNLPPSMQGWAYVLQTSFVASGANGKGQIAISYAYEPTSVATRFYAGGNWSAWQEMMPKTGGLFSGDVQFNSPPRSGATSVYTTMTNVGMWSSSGTLHMMSDGGLNIVNQANNGFKPINASAFNVNSSKSVKTDITEYAGALDKINNAKIYKYTRTDDGTQQIGLITEDVTTPAELKHKVEKPNGNGEKPRARAAAKPEMTETIDLYSFISLVSQSVKELKAEKDAEIEVLKSKITALDTRLKALEVK